MCSFSNILKVFPKRPQGCLKEEQSSTRSSPMWTWCHPLGRPPTVPPMQASNIDDVLGHHTSFLDSCLKDCMLTNPELLRVFSKLMSVCVMFTNCMQVPLGLGVRWAWGGSHDPSLQPVLAAQGLRFLAEIGRG